MKTTSTHFSDKGIVKETKDLQVSKQANYDPDKDLCEEKPKPERGNIAFEPPPEDIEELPVKAAELTIESRLDNLEKKQDQMLEMLQKLCSGIPKFTGYLTMKEAMERYETDMRYIRQRIRLYKRVKNRPVETKMFNNEELYKEEDLVQALLLDWKAEMEIIAKRDFQGD